jgi:hypothetical protein
MSLSSSQDSLEDSAQHWDSLAAAQEKNGGDDRAARRTARVAGSGAPAGATTSDGDELSIEKTLTESEMESSGSSTSGPEATSSHGDRPGECIRRNVPWDPCDRGCDWPECGCVLSDDGTMRIRA